MMSMQLLPRVHYLVDIFTSSIITYSKRMELEVLSIPLFFFYKILIYFQFEQKPSGITILDRLYIITWRVFFHNETNSFPKKGSGYHITIKVYQLYWLFLHFFIFFNYCTHKLIELREVNFKTQLNYQQHHGISTALFLENIFHDTSLVEIMDESAPYLR